MIDVCFYFQVHQPFRLRKNYGFFSIGSDHHYEDDVNNRAIMRKVADKCYLPTNQLIYDLIQKYEGKFRVSYSISGVCLEQFEMYAPEVIDSFQRLVDTGAVELINETYYHSLSFLFSREEFKRQVQAHRDKLKSLFGVEPVTFRNTELIYNNDLAEVAEEMGYKVILAEGADRIMHWRSPNFLYQPQPCTKMNMLLKNYQLSDDIAFRFSNQGWADWPLTSEKFSRWVHQVAGNGEVINLFMDYETFGEHQWESTGIFEFLSQLPQAVMKHPDFGFKTPSEVNESCQPVSKIDVPNYISWADVERDTSAWLGNSLQDSAAEYAYSLEDAVMESGDMSIIHTWRKLLTSDHFYYMCTKWCSDGDVHKYFNPYKTPYDAYISYTNVLNDLKLTLQSRGLIEEKRDMPLQ